MGSMSIWHWIIVLAVGLLLFGGRGKISELMGDFAKGIKSFKKGLSEDEKAEDEPKARSGEDHRPPAAANRRGRDGKRDTSYGRCSVRHSQDRLTRTGAAAHRLDGWGAPA